jgi:hypothetical protein
VGEIVASYTDEVGGRLSNVVIGHFPNETAVKNMDVCSIEAEIDTYENNVVSDVNDISGVALGNSSKDHPAFPGAKRLAAVQCFDSGEEDKEVAEKLTFQQVKEAVREMNIHPRQLFTIDDIKDDREFGKEFDQISTLSAENERLTKENADIKKESQDSITKAQRATATTRLDERLVEGYTDKQKSFIKNRFDPEKMEDVTDEALDGFIETAKKDFAETAKLFGVTEEDGASGDKNKSSKTVDDDVEDDEVKEALKEIGIE